MPTTVPPSSRTEDWDKLLPSGRDRIRQEAIPWQQRWAKIQAISAALVAGLLVSHALYLSASISIPIVAAIVLSLALRPLVRAMGRLKIPDAIGGLLILGSVVALVGVMAFQLTEPAGKWIARTPIKFKMLQLQQRLEPITKPIEDLKQVSDEISATIEEKTRSVDREPQPVVVEPPSLISALVSSSWQFTAGLGLCIVLTYFFLAKGETLLARLALWTASRRPPEFAAESDRIREVEAAISRYLLTVSCINTTLGATLASLFWLIGLPNPILWGVMAAILNFLPYLGGILGATVVLFVSLFSFESTQYALVAPAIYLLATAIEGNLITPGILGRSMSLNPLIVILSLTYWTWLWGVPGAVLAVPLLAVAVTAFRQFETTRPLAHLLSD